MTLGNDWQSPMMPVEVRNLASLYERKYHDTMPATVREPTVMLDILSKAWAKAGTVDVDATIAELEKLGKVETTFGPVLFGGKEFYGINRQLHRTVYITTARDGKIVTLEAVFPEILN